VISMIPVLERGYTFWDRSMLPSDEFEERTRTAQAMMAQEDLDALLVWSQSYHSNGDLAWLSGWPMAGGLVVRRDGEPTMFSPGGGRELYFQRMQTWLNDIRSVPGSVGKGIAALMSENGVSHGRIGVIGRHLMSKGGLRDLDEHLGGYTLVEAGDAYSAMRAAKRPREILAARAALVIAEAAVQAGQDAYDGGASNAEAMVAAERVARLHGARDWRCLANLTGRGLRPFERLGSERQERLRLWVAVDQSGYWAHSSTPGAAAGTANRALDAMIACAGAGARGGDVAEAGLAVLGAEDKEAALSYGLGSGIGLDLEEAPAIVPGSAAVLVKGGLLALRVVTSGALDLATAMVEIGGDTGRRIVAS
jgi:Xaa-Pro aminopeptidase